MRKSKVTDEQMVRIVRETDKADVDTVARPSAAGRPRARALAAVAPTADPSIADVPMRAMLRRNLDGLLEKGAEPTLYASLRHSCVDAWDKRWEPLFCAG